VPAAPIADESTEETVAEVGDEDALEVPDVSAEPLAPEIATTAPTVVYVNFGGPIVRTCSSFCNDATTNHSTLVSQTFKKSSVDFAAYTSSTGRTTIMSKLRAYYAAYDVVFTTKRPATAPYTMVVISPSNVGPIDRRGTSYLDCNNGNKKDIAFVYRIGSSTPAKIAKYAAHELGHTFGLMHVTSTVDLMQYASSGYKWTYATLDVARNPPGYSCFGTSTKQNAPLTLQHALGLKP